MGLILGAMGQDEVLRRTHELESKKIEIKEAKMELTKAGNDLAEASSKLDEDNPVKKQLLDRRAKLNAMEKQLDVKLEEYNKELEMIKAMKGSYDKNFKDGLGTLSK